MQKLALLRHPDTPCDAVRRIVVEIERRTDAMTACFQIAGDIARLRLPERQTPQRRDELWRHTCCELFVRPEDGRGYLEFNCAPSTEWAAYQFDDYRQGMRNADVPAPSIDVTVEPACVTVQIQVLLPITFLRLNVACVIEEHDGRISYWALRHPPGKPDFHHRDGFAVELQP